MPRRATIRAALLVLAVLLVQPAGVQSQVSVTVTRDEASVDFPETITFYLDANSESTIEQVEIEYGVERRACGVASSRVPAEFEPGTAVSASWSWNMRAIGPLPPGTRLWWRWRITLEDGAQERTEQEWLTFSDTNHAWQILSQQDITIAWYQGDESFGQALLEAGIEGLERLAAQPGDVLQEPVQVFVYSNSADLREAVIFSPDWIGGRAYPAYNIILMAVSPQLVDYGEEVLRHEMSHLVVHQITFNCWGNSVPPWLDEGLAVYAEGDQPGYDELVDQAIENDELLTLHILSGSFSADDEQASLSYAQSYRVVRYLIDTYGREKILDVLAELGDGVPINEALQSIYGFDTEGLEAEWRRAVGARPLVSATATVPIEPEETPIVTAEVTPVPSPMPGFTPTPRTLSLTLSHNPPTPVLDARLVAAPSPVGAGEPASGPLVLLITGILLLALFLGLAFLAWRRRLPWWPAPLVAVIGALFLGGYLLANGNAGTYNRATDAFQQGEWQEAIDGYDKLLAAQPAFLRVNAPLAQANRGAAQLNLSPADPTRIDQARIDLEAALEATPEHQAMDLARVYLAHWHLLYGEIEEALPLLDEVLERQPELAPALVLRAKVLHRLGDAGGASRDAEAALEAEPASSGLAHDQVLGTSHAIRGAVRLQAGNVEGALTDAEEALARTPALALAHAVRGGVRLAQGKTTEAYADAENALAIEPDLPLALAVRAGVELTAGHPSRAATDAGAAHELQPSLAWAHALHAAAAWQLGDLETAGQQAQAALTLNSEEPLAFAAQAGLALAEHRLDDAWALTDQALEIQPQLGQALAVRAVVHCLRHQPEEARQDAEAALQTQPYLALAHAALAASALDLHDPKTALDSADQAVALGEAVAGDGAPALAYAARAGARIHHSQILSGLEDAERVVALDPDLALGYLFRGAAHLSLGRLALANADLDQALTLDPELVIALAHQAELALKRQDLQAALERAEAALDQDPSLALAHTWKARALGGMGQFKEAEEALTQALLLDANLPQAYVVRASLSALQGEIEEALADLDTALDLNPHHTPAYQQRAWLHLELGDYQEGQIDADQAVSELPSVETYVTRASIRRFLGRHQEALDDLDRAEESAPESGRPCLVRVYVHEEMHDPEAAMSQAEEAIAREPEHPDIYVARGWLYLQRHDYEAAQDDIDRALELNPWSIAAHDLRAGVRMKLGNRDSAAADAYRAVWLAPGDANARQTRASLRLQAGSFEEALADADRAVDLAPGMPGAYLSRAIARAANNLPGPAGDDVEQAIELLPDHAFNQASAAAVWLVLDEPEAAIEACDQALELDPDLVEAYVVRAQAHLALTDPSEAVQDLSRALRLDRSNPAAYATRAQAYLAQSKPDKALADAEKAVGLDAYSSLGHLALCQAQLFQDDYEAALEPCDRAVELSPSEAKAYLARGLAYRFLGRLEEALADMDELVRLAPEWDEAYWHRAQVYELLGQLDEAIADLEEAQRLTEDTEVRRSLGDAIEILQTTHIAVGGPAIYTDDEYDFSLRYPEGWRSFTDLSGYSAVRLQGPMRGGYTPAVNVTIEEPTSYRTLPDLAEEIDRQLRWSLSGYEVLDRQETLLGGEPALLHIARSDFEPSGELRWWLVYSLHGRQAVMVALAAHSSQFADNELLFQEILDSFAFTD